MYWSSNGLKGMKKWWNQRGPTSRMTFPIRHRLYRLLKTHPAEVFSNHLHNYSYGAVQMFPFTFCFLMFENKLARWPVICLWICKVWCCYIMDIWFFSSLDHAQAICSFLLIIHLYQITLQLPLSPPLQCRDGGDKGERWGRQCRSQSQHGPVSRKC